MKRIILFISTLILLCISVQINAQAIGKVKRAKILQKPKLYDPPSGAMAPVGSSKVRVGTESNWIVFADRDNTPTFKSSDGVGHYKEINFMDPFYVIAEKGEFLRIVKYDFGVAKLKGSVYKITSEGVDYGWVNRREILQWNQPLVNPNNDFVLKALTVHKITDLGDIRNTEGKRLKLYNSPTLHAQHENQSDIRLLEFLFIFKKEDGAYLVGISNAFAPLGANQIIMGWVSEEVIQLWDQRVCLEPNWDEDAAKERQQAGIKVSLMDSADKAAEFKTSGKPDRNNVIWDNDTYSKRQIADWKRLPVINNNNGIYKTGFITDIFNNQGQAIINTEEHAKVQKEYNRVRDKAREVNIVFVVDGTTSMQPYLPTVTDAIESCFSSFGDSQNKYKIGAVMYGNNGSAMLEKEALSSNYQNTIAFLKNYQNNPKIMDSEQPSAMFNGLNKALYMFDKDETNVIILIGDAGTNARISTSSIVSKMQEMECSLLSFQIRNINELHDDFINQSKELIIQSACTDKDFPCRLRPADQKNAYRLDYPTESYLPGSLTHAGRGEAMDNIQLKNEIVNMISSLETNHAAVLAALEKKMSSLGGGAQAVNPAMRRILEKMDVSPTTLQKIQENNYQLFIEGYAAVEVDNLQHPLFNHVLFLTNQEVNKLEAILIKVTNINTPSQARKFTVDAYREILIAHIGEEEARAAIATKSPAEILEDVIGLPSRSELLDKYTVAELEDKRKVSDGEFRDIMNYMSAKLLAMKKVVGNTEYLFRSRDETYYWVPQEVLP